ncbi:hypothetical protein TSOC_013889, partial [Tetrabaena socialis]
MPEQEQTGAPAAKEWDEDFLQCLELLRGPGDERRFVGLLLVTRLLPHGSDEAVRAVMEALGPHFLRRLLLPLSTPPEQVGRVRLQAQSQWTNEEIYVPNSKLMTLDLTNWTRTATKFELH